MGIKGVMARVGLVVFGLVLTVVLLELSLQLGSLFIAAPRGSSTASWASEHRRILCVGDSNTWGIGLDDREREAYPAQLESTWNEGDRAPIEVLNLGYPGTNSSRLLGLFPGFLEAIAPDLVIVMIGVNDYWTEPVPTERQVHDAGIWDTLKRRSRLYKGLYMLRRRSQIDDLEIEMKQGPLAFKRHDSVLSIGDHRFELGWSAEIQSPKEAAALLKSNLHEIVRLSADSSTQLVLMTYPGRWKFYGRANKTIRTVAQEGGLPLIDLQSVFRRICTTRDCERWLLPDQHPTALGYQRVAETIVEELPKLAR